MKYQITYEDALRICEAHKNFNFYKTEYRIQEYRIVTFNYFLCEYKHFISPLENEAGIHARDMRGITFVFHLDGTLYKRFLMLEKFFNINQVEETQYDVIKNKKIKHITIKEDGSLVAFMELPNGEIFVKTQGGFNNDQCVAAMKIYEKDFHLRSFIKTCLYEGFTPLFEYVAFDNRIVLKYSTRQLKLIGIRNNESGEYYSSADLVSTRPTDLFFIDYIRSIKNISIDVLIQKAKTEENIEGWVVEFEDGQLVKLKSEWYFRLHGIRTESIFREDYVIQNYLNETLDDVLSELNAKEDVDAFAFVERVKSAVINWSNFIDESVEKLHKLYNTKYVMDWVKFATEQHKSAFFMLGKVRIERPEEYMIEKVRFMLNQANKLHKAKFIVEKWA